jgi:hypothetical protein
MPYGASAAPEISASRSWACLSKKPSRPASGAGGQSGAGARSSAWVDTQAA